MHGSGAKQEARVLWRLQMGPVLALAGARRSQSANDMRDTFSQPEFLWAFHLQPPARARPSASKRLEPELTCGGRC